MNIFADAFTLPLDGAHVVLHRQFLKTEESLQLYARLRDSLVWQQPDIYIAGKQRQIPRLQAWYGEPEALYTYSRRTFEPAYWTDELAHLRHGIERACQASFNSVLANYYRSGADSMGFHADNEPELGAQPTIASLSLGGARRFVFKTIDGLEKQHFEIVLETGDLLLMGGDTQRYWRHGLPKTRRPVAGRINLTFRYVQPLIIG